MARTHVLAGVVLFAAVGAVAAQTPSGQQPPTNKPTNPKKLTLVGCVAPDDTNDSQVTFAAKDGTTYRLSGADARKYLGQRVQIVGATNPNKLKFRTGLYPSPNVAGQAGYIDPAHAAIAEQGGGTVGVGSPELPEFKVKSVKPVQGTCPPGK